MFPAGTTTEQVTVPIIGSTAYNPSSTFKVNLQNATNGTVMTSVGTGTITSTNPAPTLAINSPGIVQPPGSGSTPDVFTVTLTGPTELSTTVVYATADGTAHAGTDYSQTNGTLTFAPGTTSAMVTVNVLSTSAGDGVNFFVNLTSPTNATITTAQGTGTIGTPAPTLSINSPTISRPTSGTTNEIFTVTLANGSTTQPTTVDFATADGTAVAGTDYSQTNGTLTFPANTTTEQVTVPIIGSTAYNPSSTFTVTLSNPSSGADLGTAVGTGTITSSNPAPTLAIATPSALTRPTSGTANYIFTVTLTGPTELPATVHYATADGTAIHGTDYQMTSGPFSVFPAGITTEQITVPVIGFTTPTGSVSFTVNLTSPTNSTITTAQATGTIVTPAGPTLSINSPAAVTKPSAGNTIDDIFTVTLANPSNTLTTTVNFATADGTAVQGLDYTSTSGTLTFAPGTTTEQVTVPVIGSNAYSPTTTFSVNLSGTTNGVIGTGQGTGTGTICRPIPHDLGHQQPGGDHPALVRQYNGRLVYGHAHWRDRSPGDGGFRHGRRHGDSRPRLPVDERHADVPGGYDQQSDHRADHWQQRLNPSSSFTVNLSAPSNATITTGQGTGTINSSNPAPTLAINSVAISRPASGTANEIFTVTLTGPTELPATVQFATADGTAIQGTDYQQTSGTLTFAAGTTTENITVPVIGSTAFNTSLNYTVNLSNPTNSTITTAQGTGTINNVAAAPTLSVNSPTVTRLTSGNVNEVFTVTLTGATALPATVQFATADNTAIQNIDYTSTSGTLTFNPGTTTQQVTVSVLPSSNFTGNLSYFLNLSSPTNSTIATAQGTGTIQPAVAAPTFAISDPTVTKPTSGTTTPCSPSL